MSAAAVVVSSLVAETTSVRLRVYGPDGEGDGVGRHFEKQLGVAA